MFRTAITFGIFVVATKIKPLLVTHSWEDPATRVAPVPSPDRSSPRDLKRRYWLAHKTQKWLICVPPKTGSTALRSFLVERECELLGANYTRCMEENRNIYGPPKLFRDLYQPTEDEILEQLQDSTIQKITITKYPLARLLSSFQKKFHGISNSNTEEFFKKFRMRLPEGADFATFLRELSKIPLHEREHHFMPTSIVCSYYNENPFQKFIDLGIDPNGLEPYFKYNTSFNGRQNLYTSSVRGELGRNSVVEVITAYSADATYLDETTRRWWLELNSRILARAYYDV